VLREQRAEHAHGGGQCLGLGCADRATARERRAGHGRRLGRRARAMGVEHRARVADQHRQRRGELAQQRGELGLAGRIVALEHELGAGGEPVHRLGAQSRRRAGS
jgi:hypothetical protein